MANPSEEIMKQADDERLMGSAVKWFCARYGTNGILKKRADGELMDTIVLVMGTHMRRAQTTGKHLPWAEDLLNAAHRSKRVAETMEARISAVLRKAPKGNHADAPKNISRAAPDTRARPSGQSGSA